MIVTSLLLAEMSEEILQLSQRAYPELREYCRQKYGVDFHAVDVERDRADGDDVRDNHDSMRVIMDQIEHAQNTSVGPYFVVRTIRKL